MIRGRDIIKLPVYSRDTGTKVGRVEDLVVDRKGTHVLGIVVGEKLLGSPRVVPWSAILVAGRDAVIIDAETSVVKASANAAIDEVLARGFVLQGSSLQTTGGSELGKIENFFFNGATGIIDGFELRGSSGEGRPKKIFLPAHPSFESGKDATFVDPAAADTMEDLKAALKARTTP